MSLSRQLLFAVSVLCLSTSATAQDPVADAVRLSGQASAQASAGAAHAIAASGRATLGASAVPLAIGGSVGAVSGAAARDSMRAANAPIGTPLEITDETITVIPPNEALKPQDPAKQN